MINQNIKQFIRFLIFFIGFALFSSEQEKTYQFIFVEKDTDEELINLGFPIIITEDQLNEIGLMKDFFSEFKEQAPQKNGIIRCLVEQNDLKEIITSTFQNNILPIITKFIPIKNRIDVDYFKIISLIDFVKGYDYDVLKSALKVIDYLQVSSVIKRAFANACYDKKPEYLAQKATTELKSKQVIDTDNEENYKKAYKKVYEDIEAQEKDFIDEIIKKSLISLRDLPKDLRESNDFIGKGLRSLDGIEELIKDEYAKGPIAFIDFRKNFNFKQNFIQDVDSLSSLVKKLTEGSIRNCRFIIYLDKEKLSEKAKESCETINQPIVKSKFADKFQNLKESDLIPDPYFDLKNKISNVLGSTPVALTGFFSTVGLHAWLTWKFNSFFSNKITYLGKQILSPRLFKKFEKIPLKALPLTLLMTKLTWKQYYNQVTPRIEKVIFLPIERMLRHEQLVDPDDLQKFRTVSMYIIYDK